MPIAISTLAQQKLVLAAENTWRNRHLRQIAISVCFRIGIIKLTHYFP